MEKGAGAVQVEPNPAVVALEALAKEDPVVALAEGEALLAQTGLDLVSQAFTYLFLCRLATCVLRRASVETVFWGHEAVRLAKQLPDLEGCRLLFDARVALGRAAILTGDWVRAADALQDALDMPLDWLDRQAIEWEVMSDLARAQYGRSEYMNALSIVDGAATLLPLFAVGRAQLGLWRARCLIRMGDAGDAQQTLASFTATEWRLPPRLAAEHGALRAIVAALLDEWPQAEREAEAALAMAERIEERPAEALACLVLAWCANVGRRFHRATDLAARGNQVAFAVGAVPLLQEVAWLMGQIYPQERFEPPEED
jgi:hypothetical protein